MDQEKNPEQEPEPELEQELEPGQEPELEQESEPEAGQEQQEPEQQQKPRKWHTWISWVLTSVLVAILVSVLYWQPILASELGEMMEGSGAIVVEEVSGVSAEALANMPYFEISIDETYLERDADAQTIAPTRPRSESLEYTVESGDALFSIASKYSLEPETVLWANYDVLGDDPDSLSVGQVLTIPPTDGILYEWEEGDILEEVANEYDASVDDILSWSGNGLDITDPVIEVGETIMIPGGERETVQTWLVTTYAVGSSGVYSSIGGTCEIEEGTGSYGTGTFVWPADNHYLSGNDYWSGHLGIDIAAATGAPIYASDSGVVTFSGWYSSYGYMIMIDHQNGYFTVYAHLSIINVSCGTSVYQGQMIGNAGSTGNSTGPHLHFEVRYYDGFINPWYVLP